MHLARIKARRKAPGARHMSVARAATRHAAILAARRQRSRGVRLSEARLNGNLARLLDEFDLLAGADPRLEQRRAEPHRDAERVARRLPLSHACSSEAFLGIARSRGLRSQRSLRGPGVPAPVTRSVEVELDTDDHVFAFVAPFRYPDQVAGLRIAAQIEPNVSRRSVATPFDSGGLVAHCERADPSEPVRAFLDRHELPVPDYRAYLERLLTCAFASPWRYVDGDDPDAVCPPGLTGGDARRHTFEVRVHRELTLEDGVLAVFLTAEMAVHDDVADALADWRLPDESVRIHPVDPSTDAEVSASAWGGLSAECKRFLDAHLERPDDE